MEYPKTESMRPVCTTVQDAIGEFPTGRFNFGLYFQKWFYVVNHLKVKDNWQRSKAWTCCLHDETTLERSVGKGQFDVCHPNPQLDNFAVSITMFNGEKQYARQVLTNKNGHLRAGTGKQNIPGYWNRKEAEKRLQSRNDALEECALAYAKLGYKYLKIEAQLQAPLVIGLGNEHPTEKGFRFDWTMGIPYMPSSSIKGVVRLAALVSELDQFSSLEAPEAQSFLKNIEKEIWPGNIKQLFGTGGEKDALRGKVIFFDAFPTDLPKLKPEIMNCHYPDYLNKGERGPTEDQPPNPQKFWAVDPCVDEKRKPLIFLFRMLLHRDIENDKDLKEDLVEAIKFALEEHGLGAKTAIGHGRFVLEKSGNATVITPNGIEAEQRADEILVSSPAHDSPSPPKIISWQIWEKAVLTWNPGNETLTANWQSKKATVKGKELIPPELHNKLFGKKRKPVTVRVEVEPVGNAFKIVSVTPQD